MTTLRPTSVLLGVLVDKAVFIAAVLGLAGLVGVEAPAFQSLALALGLTATALGALVAARHARHRPLAHGFAVGVVAVAVSFGRFVVNSIWPLAEAAARHAISWELLGWSGALLAGARMRYRGGPRCKRNRALARRGGACSSPSSPCLRSLSSFRDPVSDPPRGLVKCTE